MYVPPEYMDLMGHMNVQYYARLFDAATWALFSLAGIDRAYIVEKQCGMAALEQHIRYVKEVHAGTSVQIWSHIQMLGPKLLRLKHRMIETQDDRLIAELDQKAVHFDLAGRKSKPFPDSVVERLNELAMQDPIS